MYMLVKIFTIQFANFLELELFLFCGGSFKVKLMVLCVNCGNGVIAIIFSFFYYRIVHYLDIFVLEDFLL